ncbi:MAG: YbbR-like domain-containing protein [Myxococcales bacterium]|nr:YbbR-like domain-containing protein [Myxococcales bacterium]MCB9642457.1 YbbR-like domain-containing protein [Myxococcales bacterium]
MLSWLRAALFENLGLKIFAFFLSVVLFRYVKGEQDRVSTVEVKLLYKLPKTLVMISEPVSMLKVTLRGPETKLRGVDSRPLSYTFQFKNASPGPTQYQLYVEQLRPLFPPEVQVIRLTPSILDFSLDSVAKRTLPVRVQLQGKTPLGYELLPVKAFPVEVPVEGPESIVKRLRSVQTRPLELTGITQNAVRELLLEPPGKYVQFLGESKVRVKLRIRAILQKKSFTNVPVKLVGFPVSAQTKVTLGQDRIDITLFGPLAQLHPLQAKDIVAEADASKLATKGAGTYEAPLRVRFPAPDLKIISPPTPKAVQVVIKALPASPRPAPKRKVQPDEEKVPPKTRKKRRRKKRKKARRKPKPREKGDTKKGKKDAKEDSE